MYVAGKIYNTDMFYSFVSITYLLCVRTIRPLPYVDFTNLVTLSTDSEDCKCLLIMSFIESKFSEDKYYTIKRTTIDNRKRTVNTF